jgi:hypothetical protein
MECLLKIFLVNIMFLTPDSVLTGCHFLSVRDPDLARIDKKPSPATGTVFCPHWNIFLLESTSGITKSGLFFPGPIKMRYIF